MAQLSLLGLYNYRYDVFDELVLPEIVDRETLVDNLLIECAELEILYPNPDFLKLAVGAWSKKQLPTWEKQAATLQLEYNPLENYRRTETWDNSETAEGNSKTDSEQSGSNKSKVAGFNSPALVDQSEDNTATEGSTVTNVDSTRATKHVGNITGATGFFSPSALVEEERRVATYNLYDVIITEFKRRFCLLVY